MAAPEAPTSASPAHARRPWRENIEAMAMAIVVALLFKYFVLEISKIPSGSMQPTLMGNPETGVFDRTLVDKLSYHFREPERFEIVVFKHPLERSRVMVKRLVGMPGEELKIEFGDLWTRARADEPWRILRRPPRVQAAFWRTLRPSARTPDWTVVRGGKEWQVTSTRIVARGDGEARFRGPIRDGYLDGYPRQLDGKISADPRHGNQAVGDVRLEGELTAQADTSELTFELTEGQRVYEFTLPGPAAPEAAELRVRIRDSLTQTERIEHGPRVRAPAGERVGFALENLDDRLAFELEDEPLLTAEIEASPRQEAFLKLGVTGGGAEFDELCVRRDIYYLQPGEEDPARARRQGAWSVAIPPGNYVMLGDNTQDSADGRLWEAQTWRQPGAGPGIRGNYRFGENPVYGHREIRFRDEWGEVHFFPRVGGPTESFGGAVPAPLVPRELVLGRALAIFWPIQLKSGLWRLGWLH
jgi:signal peptidase I